MPEVIQTSEGNSYLHLPGVIVTENITGEVRYLLSDGLGSIRQAVDDTGAVVAYNEYDPYGNSIVNQKSKIQNPYGFTGEWWQDEIDLLYLRARWYMPETGNFLSRDPVEGEPPYQYVRGNPINLTDPGGMFPDVCHSMGTKEEYARCVLNEYGLWPATLETPGAYWMFQDTDIMITPFQTKFNEALFNEELYNTKNDAGNVEGHDNCWYGPIPYISMGYLEGLSDYFFRFSKGKEVVYDLARMERRSFHYEGQTYSDGIIGTGVTANVGAAIGFRSNYPIDQDYEGPSEAYSGGLAGGYPTGFELGPSIGVGMGASFSYSAGTWQVASFGWYYSFNATGIEIPVIDGGYARLNYEADPPSTLWYYARSGQSETSPFSYVDKAKLVSDILHGTNSPMNMHPASIIFMPHIRAEAVKIAIKAADLHDDMYFGSRRQQ